MERDSWERCRARKHSTKKADAKAVESASQIAKDEAKVSKDAAKKQSKATPKQTEIPSDTTSSNFSSNKVSIKTIETEETISFETDAFDFEEIKFKSKWNVRGSWYSLWYTQEIFVTT